MFSSPEIGRGGEAYGNTGRPRSGVFFFDRCDVRLFMSPWPSSRRVIERRRFAGQIVADRSWRRDTHCINGAAEGPARIGHDYVPCRGVTCIPRPVGSVSMTILPVFPSWQSGDRVHRPGNCPNVASSISTFSIVYSCQLILRLSSL
jgi:hypothetical protein